MTFGPVGRDNNNNKGLLQHVCTCTLWMERMSSGPFKMLRTLRRHACALSCYVASLLGQFVMVLAPATSIRTIICRDYRAEGRAVGLECEPARPAQRTDRLPQPHKGFAVRCALRGSESVWDKKKKTIKRITTSRVCTPFYPCLRDISSRRFFSFYCFILLFFSVFIDKPRPAVYRT